jgi:hypothetical protein
MKHSRPIVLTAAGLIGFALLSASQVPAAPPAAETDLAAVRAATEKYRDVQMALAEGYLRDPSDMCVTAPLEGLPAQLGGMGIHYFRPDLLAIAGTAPRVHGNGTHTDFLQPGVLIYEPQADGSLELVAIENLVWAKAWREAGNTAPPVFNGQEYYYMHNNPETQVDEAHGFDPHYELHVWLYRDNPSGMYMQFNPNVTCEYHGKGQSAHAVNQAHATADR